MKPLVLESDAREVIELLRPYENGLSYEDLQLKLCWASTSRLRRTLTFLRGYISTTSRRGASAVVYRLTPGEEWDARRNRLFGVSVAAVGAAPLVTSGEAEEVESFG